MPPETQSHFQLPPSPAAVLDDARPGFAYGLWELTKPRLSCLSVLTALVGYLAAQPERNMAVLLNLVFGTALAAGGAAALNQWIERRTDAIMRRTQARPIPGGLVKPSQALAWGLMLSLAGPLQILLGVNALAGGLAAVTVASYVLVYTPSKRRTRWSTEIGAISGALPPLIGWAGARGTVDGLGWILFAILFFWQIPHFLGIAWMYRGDYAAARFPMLPVIDPAGGYTARWLLANTVALVAVSVAPVGLGLTGPAYGLAAIGLGAVFLVLAGRMLSPAGRDRAARRVFFYSIVYLPALLAVLVLDRWLLS